MTSAPRFWKKDWLKLKSSFWKVNRQYTVQGPGRKPKEAFGRAQRQTPQILSNLYFLLSFIYVALLKDESSDHCLNFVFVGRLCVFLNLVWLATCVSCKFLS